MYIAIEGLIGIGKTTLARSLYEEITSWGKDADLVLETFEDNPFLRDFYKFPERYALPTQLFFLVERHKQMQQLRSSLAQGKVIISDYIFRKNDVFAELTISGEELSLYKRITDATREALPEPHLVIMLKGSVEIASGRIALRGREYEQGISTEYLSQLAKQYDTFWKTYTDAPLLILDATKPTKELLEILRPHLDNLFHSQ